MTATWISLLFYLLLAFFAVGGANLMRHKVIANDRRLGILTNKPWTGDKAGQDVSKELALPDEPIKSYEVYDHPAPPILVLRSSMPSAPTGYGWELYVTTNDEGNPALRLSMLDLKTSTVIDAIEADLVIVRRWKYAAPDTYASFYRRVQEKCATEITGYQTVGSGFQSQRWPKYGQDPTEMLGKVMMANLITPMVDWARLITLRYIVDHPDETKCNYVLLESPEGVPA